MHNLKCYINRETYVELIFNISDDPKNQTSTIPN